MKYSNIVSGVSIAAFIFWALALLVPTGYSYGAVGLVLMSLLGCRGALCQGVNRTTWMLAGVIVAMGLLWALAFDGWLTWTGTDYLAKYWLAAFCLVVVAYRGVESAVIPWAFASGALGALVVALYQYFFLGIGKATGFTNAIQYGGIAMYLGLATWVFALLAGYRRLYAVLLWCLGSLGVLASVLSETRGAWLAAPLLVLALGGILLQHGYRRLAMYAVIAPVLLGTIAVMPLWDRVAPRVEQAVAETRLYSEQPEQGAITSIGQRLEQWQLAWRLGVEKPVTGWGVQGFIAGKKNYVEQGKAHSSVQDYGHVHNEMLDMFAKRGSVGVLLLLLFYAIPLVVFWPTLARIRVMAVPQQKFTIALRTVASMLPLAYFGFGWTQVFFAHNSGNMFYIFSLVALWGGIRYQEGKTFHAAIPYQPQSNLS